VSLDRQSDCLLRISQSCLEQTLFRDHFGPDGGQSVCLRVLKVLRDITRTFDKFWFLLAISELRRELGRVSNLK